MSDDNPNPEASTSHPTQQGGGNQPTQQDGGQPTQQASGSANAQQSVPREEGEFNGTTQSVSDGKSVTDIFSRPDTKPLLIQTIALFSAVGVGYAVMSYLSVNQLVGGGGPLNTFGAGIVLYVFVIVASLIGPILGLVMGIRTNGMLDGIRDDIAFATGGVGAAAGQVVLILLTALAATTPLPAEAEIGIGDFTSLILLSAIATGIVAALGMYVLRNVFVPPSTA